LFFLELLFFLQFDSLHRTQSGQLISSRGYHNFLIILIIFIIFIICKKKRNEIYVKSVLKSLRVFPNPDQIFVQQSQNTF